MLMYVHKFIKYSNVFTFSEVLIVYYVYMPFLIDKYVRYIKKELQQMEWNKNTPLNLLVRFCKASPADNLQM